MEQAYNFQAQSGYPATSYRFKKSVTERSRIKCKWNDLRAQLLLQWQRLSASDIDQAGPDRDRLAMLIQQKYGIAAELVENYLRNFERTLPVM